MSWFSVGISTVGVPGDGGKFLWTVSCMMRPQQGEDGQKTRSLRKVTVLGQGQRNQYSRTCRNRHLWHPLSLEGSGEPVSGSREVGCMERIGRSCGPEWESSDSLCLDSKKVGVSIAAQRVKNPTSIHEDAGSIPSLAQWVGVLALPWAVV